MHDDVAGPGNGFIDAFDTDGNLLRRFASQGPLNSPHGLALAPADFGAFGGTLLVGNFGDGRISAFDPSSGSFLGQLSDAGGRPLTNVGIWGMTFGNGAGGTRTNTLYFAAGINGEQDGLLGAISLDRGGDHRGHGDRDSDDNRQRVEVGNALFALLGRAREHQANPGGDHGQDGRERPRAAAGLSP
jgi:hypothetical protein